MGSYRPNFPKPRRQFEKRRQGFGNFRESWARQKEKKRGGVGGGRKEKKRGGVGGAGQKKVRRVGWDGWVMKSSKKIKNEKTKKLKIKKIKNNKNNKNKKMEEKEPHQEKRPHLEDFFPQLVFNILFTRGEKQKTSPFAGLEPTTLGLKVQCSGYLATRVS